MPKWRRRSAYYGGNYGNEYSRSRRADEAESSGRYPRTRAASALGVSVKAFDAGCQAMEYRTSEWHHVGKYATMVDYWDTQQCSADWRFWAGAATAYKGRAKRNELEVKAKLMRREELVAKLERQRDCSHHVLRRSTKWNWEKLVHSLAERVGISTSKAPTHVPPGNFSLLTATLAAMKNEQVAA